MNLDRVTITGADDSILPNELRVISGEYPFVEWGILASSSHSYLGSPRFPSIDWLHELAAASEGLNLSLHLCGSWVCSLLRGMIEFPVYLLEPYQRVQLNFHADRTECYPERLLSALRSIKVGPAGKRRQFIFQLDGAKGDAHLESIYGEDHPVDAVPLFDISGGAGILPQSWPKPEYMNNDVDHCYHGYAGGLGPDNLEQQLPLIAAAAGDTRIWIDMETRVRSADDRQFDLAKVRRCLEICAPFIKQPISA